MKTIEIKKVLIALDYNPTAQKVAEQGFLMANAMKAEIILLHVISNPVFYSSSGYSPIMGFTGFMMDPTQLSSIEELKKVSLNFLDKSKHYLGDKSIQTIVKEGDIAESIFNTAKDLHVDIIVMGSHSQKWLENIIMGSVTEKVLLHTSIPLFIIPTKKSN
ncbi:MAG: universal stress protein [Ignavibacteria bacterium]|nr:universal stress protein [Ignavibacteria bacterium]